MSLSVLKKIKTKKKSLPHYREPLLQNQDKDKERAKTRSEDNKKEDAGLQQIRNVSSFGINAGRVCEESPSSKKTTEFHGDKIATRRGRALAIDCRCFFLDVPAHNSVSSLINIHI